MKQTLFGLACFIAIFNSAQCFAQSSLDKTYESLMKKNYDYTVYGVVCEVLAKDMIEKSYPSDRYNIVIGIAYKNRRRTIGELDLVILRKSDGEAISVGEVKCGRNLSATLKKAKTQLRRFHSYRNSDQLDRLTFTDNHEEYKPRQFDGQISYFSVAQRGAKDAGFTFEIPISHKEIKSLHERLKSCQSHPDCLKRYR